MAKEVSGINPRVLRWARERAGYILDDVARAFKKDVETIKSWESGRNAPTYVQLEKLAYKLYKRPIAIFFFPELPEERDQTKEFRTLPKFEIEKLSIDTRYAIRQAEAMQSILMELNEGTNPSKDKIFQDIKATPKSSADELAKVVRDYLKVTLSIQSSWKNNDEALQNWRMLLQEKGVFIFKRSFKQRDVSGFCLVDEEFPVIYLNNSTAESRQIFTMFHELAHILLQTSGITKQNDRYIEKLSGTSRAIEVFSNQFAAEFLVPSEDFEGWIRAKKFDDESIGVIANRYHVSREVILRKLLDRGLVSRKYYEDKTEEWIAEYEKRKSKRAGGNYYATQATYLGDKYLKLVFSKYYQGRYTLEQLADYLNVKVGNVSAMVDS